MAWREVQTKQKAVWRRQQARFDKKKWLNLHEEVAFEVGLKKEEERVQFSQTKMEVRVFWVGGEMVSTFR